MTTTIDRSHIRQGLETLGAIETLTDEIRDRLELRPGPSSSFPDDRDSPGGPFAWRIGQIEEHVRHLGEILSRS